MEILGHSQIALTMNSYSPVAPEVSREAAERIAETLWQDGEDEADEPDAAELDDARRTTSAGCCCSLVETGSR
jgi:integrase